MTNDKIKGIFWAAVSMVLWASSFPVGRELISNKYVDPTSLGMLRFCGASLLMMAIAPAMGKRLTDFSKSEYPKMMGLGALGISLMAAFLFFGQKTVASINAAMIEAESPIFIFLMTLWATRKFSVLQALGLLIGFFGCLMSLKIIDAGGFHLSSYCFGDFLVMLSSICWSLYTVLGKKTVARVGAYAYTAWTMFFGMLWLGCFIAVRKIAGAEVILPSTGYAWGLIAYYAAFPTALAFFAWNRAQSYISVVLLSLSEYFTPFTTAVIAFVLFKEPVTALQLVGAVVICGAVLIETGTSRMVKREKDAG